MCFYYDEYAEFFDDNYVKCRKAHRCEECNQPIQIGELAYATSGKFDGNMFSAHYCGACELTRYNVHLHEIEEGCTGEETWCPSGELMEYCAEHDFPRANAEAGQQYLATKRSERAQKKSNRATATA